MADENQNDVTALTVQLLSAFVSNNKLASEALADLIKATRAALTEDPAASAEAPAPEYQPAVSIRKSLSSPDHILSLIDGKPYKTLKRHLASHGLTEKDYRERYKLPASYPLVAPSYSNARRAVAERLGLGRKPVSGTPVPTAKAAAAKKQAGKGAASQSASIAGPAASSPEPTKKSSAKAAPAAKSGRRKLSITTPSVDKAEPAAAAEKSQSRTATTARSNASGKVASTAKTSAPKAKSGAKPRNLKAALGAASAHLGVAPADPAKSKES